MNFTLRLSGRALGLFCSNSSNGSSKELNGLGFIVEAGTLIDPLKDPFKGTYRIDKGTPIDPLKRPLYSRSQKVGTSSSSCP